MKKYHHTIRASATTLIWKNMEAVMTQSMLRVTFPIVVNDAFILNNREQLVVNGNTIYDIRSKTDKKTDHVIEKCGSCVIEHDIDACKSYITSSDIMYTTHGLCSCYKQKNMIIINPTQHWYYDDMEPSHNREYDPKINRYIINDVDGFAVTTLDFVYDKNTLISDVDNKDTDSCFFQCDDMLYSFSEDMRFVAYVCKNSLYVSRTIKPFYMHMVSTRFNDTVHSVSTTDRTVVVACNACVYIFNYVNIKE